LIKYVNGQALLLHRKWKLHAKDGKSFEPVFGLIFRSIMPVSIKDKLFCDDGLLTFNSFGNYLKAWIDQFHPLIRGRYLQVPAHK
jgi:hypothetical protein